MTIISTILTRVNFSHGLLLCSAKTNSPKLKLISFGRIREKCYSLQVYMSEDHAHLSLFKKDIGSAHMNNGKIYSCHTTKAPPIDSCNTTMNSPEFGTLLRRIFPDSMAQWLVQQKPTLKTLDISLLELKKLPFKKSSSIN